MGIISILLTILKWLVIIVGVLLGVILLFVLLLLIVPICYRIHADFYDNRISARGKFSYFGPLFKGNFHYNKEDSLKYKVKALWITLAADDKEEIDAKKEARRARFKQAKLERNRKRKEKKQEKEKKRREYNKIQIENEPEPEKIEEAKESKTSEIDTPLYSDKKAAAQSYEKQEKAAAEPRNTKDEELIADEVGIIEKIAAFFNRLIYNIKSIKNKIISIWNRIKNIFKSFIERLTNARDKSSLLYKLWQTETTKRAYERFKKKFGFLLKHLKPSKVAGRLYFGMDDPAATGEALAAISVIYPIIGPHITIVPNFEETCFESEIEIKGHICLIFIGIFFDKYIKKTYQRFQHITGGN